MLRMSLEQLEARCQKPDHRRVGTWMARRVARPAALRVTWLVAPWGVTANMATLTAWAVGLGAAGCLATGSAVAWLAAAILLQLWYLLDHVDGQLARLRGTASLDGVQLDYLMHHTLNLLVPLGAGWGLCQRTAQTCWVLVGVAWGTASLLTTLHHDARYKAFVQRLKCVRGRLEVAGGALRPEPAPPRPRGALRLLAWAARKSCEMHVVMNLFTLIAAIEVLADPGLLVGRAYAGLMAVVGPAVAVWTLAKSQRRGAAESEFAAWFRPPEGSSLALRDGWWIVEGEEAGQVGQERLQDAVAARVS